MSIVKLETEEISAVVADYRKAAERARSAGFDGVEVHATNGYLIDEFLQSKTNNRTDRYGGSLENRFRFQRLMRQGHYRMSPAFLLRTWETP